MGYRFKQRGLRSRRTFRISRGDIRRNSRKRNFGFPGSNKNGYYRYKIRPLSNGGKKYFRRRFRGKITNEKLDKELDNYFKKNEKKEEQTAEVKKEEKDEVMADSNNGIIQIEKSG